MALFALEAEEQSDGGRRQEGLQRLEAHDRQGSRALNAAVFAAAAASPTPPARAEACTLPTVGVRDAPVKSPPAWRGVENCPLPQDLPDILTLERRLSHSPMCEGSPLLR
jgi:hypothetical protein